MIKGNVAAKVLLASVFILQAVATAGDTLFKGPKPVAIGHGETQGEDITWTDCAGQQGKKYKKPPYWVDKTDNCDMQPGSFGLMEKNGKYKVVNESEFQKFFPDAENGDEANFTKTSAAIVLKYRGRELRLSLGAED